MERICPVATRDLSWSSVTISGEIFCTFMDKLITASESGLSQNKRSNRGCYIVFTFFYRV